jgi:hypothetical protein
MTCRPRFTIYEDAKTRTWSVFDRLRGYSSHTRLERMAATSIAHAQEHAWRQRCAAWQQAEHRDNTA